MFKARRLRAVWHDNGSARRGDCTATDEAYDIGCNPRGTASCPMTGRADMTRSEIWRANPHGLGRIVAFVAEGIGPHPPAASRDCPEPVHVDLRVS